MEVVGFIIGVLAPVELAIKLVKDMKSRFAADEKNGPRLIEMERRFTELKSALDALRQDSVQRFRFLDDSRREGFQIQLTTMKSTCDEALNILTNIGDARDKSRIPRRLARSLLHKENLDSVEANISSAEASLNQLNGFLSTCDEMERVVEEKTDTLRQDFGQLQAKQTDSLCEALGQHEDNTTKVIIQQTEGLFSEIRSTRDPVYTFVPSFHVPPNPPHVKLDYQIPTTFESRLKAAILHAENGNLTSLLEATAAVGMGGTGKTCAMKGLADDPDIRERFPHGVYFISLGMDADSTKLISQLRDIVRVSGGDQTAKRMEIFEAAQIHTVVGTACVWFSEKDCLFLVDDLWEKDDLNSSTLTELSKLAKCSKNSAMVFSTRNQSIADLGEFVQFEDLDSHCDRSWDILLRCAGFTKTEITGDYHDAVCGLLTICSGLPVALAVVGRTVRTLSNKYKPRREKAWIEYLDTYNNLGDSPARHDIDNYKSLSKTVRASLKVLEAKREDEFPFKVSLSVPELFRSLCILKKQQAERMDILRRTWRLENSKQALRVARYFEELSLINIFGPDHDVEYHVQLHDLIHDCACIEAAEREKDALQYWHKHFLNGFITHEDESKRRGFRSWWQFISELGIDRIERHLKGAGLNDELLKLEQVPRWVYGDYHRTFKDISKFLIGPVLQLIPREAQQNVIERALMTVGRERSQRAMKCAEDIVSIAKNHVTGNNIMDTFGYFESGWNPSYVQEVIDTRYEGRYDSSVWYEEWNRSVNEITESFRSGKDPYCRTGAEIVDSS